jgi:hypothetical protein
LPFPCFPPNQPDPNVLTEVAASSGFPALESAWSAAYIGHRTLKRTLKSVPAPINHAHGNSTVGTMAGTARIFKLHSHSGKCGSESEICKRFTKIGRMPGNVVCSLANFIISVFIFR